MRLFILILLSSSLLWEAGAQELNCTVKINHAQIQGTSTRIFETLETALGAFVNERRWTQGHYEVNERIRCSIHMVVKEYNDDGRFKCDFLVQSVRPVWQSTYTTTVFNFRDADVAFSYVEFEPIELHENRIDNNLTAVMAYYAYLIIGLDMDTMAPLGGTEVLRACENIVTASQHLEGPGWKAFGSSRNRYAIISDYLNESMLPLRQLMYNYHRKGMDELAVNVARGRTNITASLPALEEAKANRTTSVLPQLFTEIKKDELANIYFQASAKEKEKAHEILLQINPSLGINLRN